MADFSSLNLLSFIILFCMLHENLSIINRFRVRSRHTCITYIFIHPYLIIRSTQSFSLNSIFNYNPSYPVSLFVRLSKYFYIFGYRLRCLVPGSLERCR